MRLALEKREFSGEVSQMKPCLLESLDDNVMILTRVQRKITRKKILQDVLPFVFLLAIFGEFARILIPEEPAFGFFSFCCVLVSHVFLFTVSTKTGLELSEIEGSSESTRFKALMSTDFDSGSREKP